jgi:hypothetical protein
MEYKKKQTLQEIAARQVADAERYATAREAAGKAELNLNVILISHIKDIRAAKKNVGVEFAQMLVCADYSEALEFYREWKNNEATCKGLEKLIDARAGQLIMEQSLLKNEREGAKWG